jgi:hypothetical protein
MAKKKSNSFQLGDLLSPFFLKHGGKTAMDIKERILKGDYYGLPQDRAYYTNSQVKMYRKCPASWKAYIDGEYIESAKDVYLHGNYVDFQITESPAVFNQFCRDNSAEIFKYGNPDKGKKEVFVNLDKAVKVLRDCPTCKRYLTGDGQATLVVDDFYGYPFRAKLDVLNLAERFLADLKTCADVTETKWSDTEKRRVLFVDYYNYWQQLAIYRELVYLLHNINVDCFLVCIEKKPHFNREVFDLTDVAHLETLIQNVVDTLERMDVVKQEGLSAEDLQHCDACEYCITNKVILEPKKLKPEIIPF